MGIKTIQITRRMTAIVEESYELQFDEDAYNKFREENPDKSYADICAELESEREDYIVSVEDINEIHEEQYEPED